MWRNYFGDYGESRRHKKRFFTTYRKGYFKNRKHKNISQQELGEVLEVSKATISRYESSKQDMPLSNLPVISYYCDFKLRDYLTEGESSDIEDFIKKSLSYKDIVPDKEILDEFINSCSDEDISDLIEIDYCFSNIKNNAYKEGISDIIIEKHLNSINKSQYTKRLTYY